MPVSPFTTAAIELIRAIPRGKVATYGGIAAMAGSPRGTGTKDGDFTGKQSVRRRTESKSFGGQWSAAGIEIY